jgi:Rieske Fe-S protein
MEPIKAFSNVVIGQFVLTRIPIKVYVDGRYLIITSTDDIQDPMIGFGMDEDGQMQQFDYRTIQQLLVGGNAVDLAAYNSAMGADEEGDSAAEEPEEEEEEPTKEESIAMTEISKDVLKAKLDVIKQQEKELKDKANVLKKEPVTEDIYDGEYTFGTGDIVKNINPVCKHYGSIGVVKKVIDLPNDMGKVVIYTVGNSGPTYKPGMSLTKTPNQLEMYTGQE